MGNEKFAKASEKLRWRQRSRGTNETKACIARRRYGLCVIDNYNATSMQQRCYQDVIPNARSSAHPCTGIACSCQRVWRNIKVLLTHIAHTNESLTLESPEIKMDVSEHFNRVFHYKPSILGYPYFWKHPYWHLIFWIFAYLLANSPSTLDLQTPRHGACLSSTNDTPYWLHTHLNDAISIYIYNIYIFTVACIESYISYIHIEHMILHVLYTKSSKSYILQPLWIKSERDIKVTLKFKPSYEILSSLRGLCLYTYIYIITCLHI